MTVERIEPETLAAFLEGRLEPGERDRVLRIIAEHPEAYEVFADAAAAVADMADERRGIAPIAARRGRPRWRWMIPAAAAAGLAAIALWPRGERPLPLALASRLRIVEVPGDGSLAARLGAEWDQPGWSVTRGEGTSLLESDRVFRLGARATDVELAIRARDSSAVVSLGEETARLLAGVEGGAAAAGLYRALTASGVRTSLADRYQAVEAIRALTNGSPWFDLGAWVEAARVALAAGQRAFLVNEAGELRRLQARLLDMPNGGEAAALLDELARSAEAGELERSRELLGRIILIAGR
ncbi:MAG: hypothetical protein ACRDFT_07595 [bacterium]